MIQPETALTLCQHFFWQTLTLLTPILLAGILVGLVIGVLQTATQIQEQTLSIAAKVIVMGFAALRLLPWMITRLLDYTHTLLSGITEQIGGPL